MKICPVGAELFHADGGTERLIDRHNKTKLVFAFRNFAKRKGGKKWGGGNANEGTGFFFFLTK